MPFGGQVLETVALMMGHEAFALFTTLPTTRPS